MKRILLLASMLIPISMANAETWIRLNAPKGFVNYIDRDSIRKKGDFAYYSMKDTYPDEHYVILKFKHDCKYNARGVLSSDYYDKNTDELIRSKVNYKREIGLYTRSPLMIKVEKMVCR